MNLIKVNLLQYKLANGRFPDRLAELGGVSNDPMDGKPLRYQLRGEGFVIYSVGKNLKDNGGLYDILHGDEVVEQPYVAKKPRPKVPESDLR